MPVVTDVLTAFADVSGPWRGGKQGFYYGFRIRFAHSLVMAFLFKKGSWKTKWHFILKNAFNHGKNLALVSFLYKAFRSILGKNQSPKKWVVLISGIIAGALAFGRNDHISEQVNEHCDSLIPLSFPFHQGESLHDVASHLRNTQTVVSALWFFSTKFV